VAIVGAYVLAQELAATITTGGGHGAAFARYEAKMRPFVERNHAIAELTRDGLLSDPDYYGKVVEPAIDAAKNAITLEGLA
jgi:2-polyprenyl-6-methoxyphenol hydroxylase-like FAD-dependent oxidoreductase